MEFRDHSIITQVAFKAAVELNTDVDITDPAGQARFEQAFGYLRQSLFASIEEAASEQAGQLVRANFPGTQQVQQVPSGGWNAQQDPGGGWQGQPQQQGFQPATTMTLPPQVRVKGNQFGPLPDWLFEEAAAKGVTEVYDNRDRATGTKRPWFRSTTGGDNAPAFWPPR